MQLSYFAPPGVACDSVLSLGAGSATLNIGPCAGPGYSTLRGLPFVTATADSFEVVVDGMPGLMCSSFDDCSVSIGASSEFDGSLEAIGGSGAAWIEFDVRSFGANSFEGDFAIPSLGVNQVFSGFNEQRQYLIPVTFGELIGYSLQVQHRYFSWGEPDLMLAGLSMYDLRVVDAAGNEIPGAQLIDPPSQEDTTIPEPGTAALLSTALGLLVLCRRRRRKLPRLCGPRPEIRSSALAGR